MDVSDIRYANLKALIAQHGGQASLGRQIDTDPSYISQIINRTLLPSGKPRNVGDDLARKIEAALSLPRGWMDQQHAEAHTDFMVAEPGATYELVTPKERALLARFRETDERGKSVITQVAESQPLNQPDSNERAALKAG